MAQPRHTESPKKAKNQKRRYPKNRCHVYLTDSTVADVQKEADAITAGNFSMMAEVLLTLGKQVYEKMKKRGRAGDAIALYFREKNKQTKPTKTK